jgi:tyrosine aminotransferase
MAKRFLVPGWRLGWAIVHDQDGKLADVKRGMVALSQKISGPSSLIQGALPAILRNTPSSHLEHVNSVLAENAHIAFDTLNRVPGLKARFVFSVVV